MHERATPIVLLIIGYMILHGRIIFHPWNLCSKEMRGIWKLIFRCFCRRCCLRGKVSQYNCTVGSLLLAFRKSVEMLPFKESQSGELTALVFGSRHSEICSEYKVGIAYSSIQFGFMYIIQIGLYSIHIFMNVNI